MDVDGDGESKDNEKDILSCQESNIDVPPKEDDSEWDYEDEEDNHIVDTVTFNENFAEEEMTDKYVDNFDDDIKKFDVSTNEETNKDTASNEEANIDTAINEEAIEEDTC